MDFDDYDILYIMKKNKNTRIRDPDYWQNEILKFTNNNKRIPKKSYNTSSFEYKLAERLRYYLKNSKFERFNIQYRKLLKKLGILDTLDRPWLKLKTPEEFAKYISTTGSEKLFSELNITRPYLAKRIHDIGGKKLAREVRHLLEKSGHWKVCKYSNNKIYQEFISLDKWDDYLTIEVFESAPRTTAVWMERDEGSYKYANNKNCHFSRKEIREFCNITTSGEHDFKELTQLEEFVNYIKELYGNIKNNKELETKNRPLLKYLEELDILDEVLKLCGCKLRGKNWWNVISDNELFWTALVKHIIVPYDVHNSTELKNTPDGGTILSAADKKGILAWILQRLRNSEYYSTNYDALNPNTPTTIYVRTFQYNNNLTPFYKVGITTNNSHRFGQLKRAIQVKNLETITTFDNIPQNHAQLIENIILLNNEHIKIVRPKKIFDGWTETFTEMPLIDPKLFKMTIKELEQRKNFLLGLKYQLAA